MGFEDDSDVFRKLAGFNIHVPLCCQSQLAELSLALSLSWLLHSLSLLSLSEALHLVPIILQEIVGINQGWALWQFLPEHQITQVTYIIIPGPGLISQHWGEKQEGLLCESFGRCRLPNLHLGIQHKAKVHVVIMILERIKHFVSQPSHLFIYFERIFILSCNHRVQISEL